MKKPKTALFTALIAAVCAAFAAVPPTGGAPARAALRAAEREEICSVTSVFSEGGEESTVRLYASGGEGSPYRTDIVVCAEGGACFAPPEDSGYSPSLAAFDFLGKGYDQLFYSASTGGSGGFGYYYVFDLSDGAEVLFDAAATDNPFSAAFADGGYVEVFWGGGSFVRFDVSDGPYGDMLWKDGRYVGSAEAYVTPVNYVQPVYEPYKDRFGLLLWQRAVGCCSAATAGYLVRLLDLRSGECFPPRSAAV